MKEVENQPLTLVVPEKKAWEQLDSEPDQAYASFIIYRDLPIHERSIEAAYNKHLSIETGSESKPIKKASMWLQYSGAYGWPKRAAAYDVYKRETISKRRLENEIERMANIKDNTIELVDLMTSEQLQALKGDEKAIARLMDKLMPLKILLGSGGAGKFILDGFKALHGEKKEVNGKFQIGAMEWKL